MKRIAVLGSTGSIGTQTLDVIAKNPEDFCVEALTCGHNIQSFKKQLGNFSPKLAVTAEEKDARELAKEFPRIEFSWGMKGIVTAASETDCDLVLNSLMGMMGLEPTYRAILAGKDIALANKETLVAGGELITSAVREQGVKLLPVDSEHGAIFQALQGNEGNPIKRILLTASGGPFRGMNAAQLEQVTLEQALAHPKWSMGSKITIDSASLMNKGLEVIEARWLFDVKPEQILVLVHPQSIVHSMVEYEDRSVIAQLAVPDMRIPISYALSYPKRLENDLPSVDFFQLGQLTFEEPDLKTFPCLQYAYDALEAGGSASVVLNAANEVLVQMFLNGKLGFMEIPRLICRAMEGHRPVYHLDLEGILEIDQKTRGEVLQWV